MTSPAAAAARASARFSATSTAATRPASAHRLEQAEPPGAFGHPAPAARAALRHRQQHGQQGGSGSTACYVLHQLARRS